MALESVDSLANLARRRDMANLNEKTWLSKTPFLKFIKGRAKKFRFGGGGTRGGAVFPITYAPAASGGLVDGDVAHVGRGTLSGEAESVTSPLHEYQSIQFRPYFWNTKTRS